MCRELPRRALLRLIAPVVALFVLSTTTNAAADPLAIVPTPEAIQLGQMESMLANTEEESSHHVVWTAVADMAIGAVSIAPGSIAITHGAAATGALTLGGGGISVLKGLANLTLYRAPFAKVYRNFRARRATMDAGSAIAETELEWAAAARSAHAARIRGGAISIAVGVLIGGFGAVAMSTNLRLLSQTTTSNDNAALDATLIAFGGATLMGGVQNLLVPDPIESGWRTYTRRLDTSPTTPTVQVVPIRQGAYVGMSLRF